MSTRSNHLFATLLIVLALAVGSIVYVSLTDQTPSHRVSGITDMRGHFSNSAVLATWQAALLRRSNVPANWVAIGESITEGQGAPNRSERWLDLVAKRLQTTYAADSGSSGDDYTPAIYRVGAPDSPWTRPWSASNGNTTPVYDIGSLGYRALKLSEDASVSYPAEGDSADIWYAAGKGFGELRYSVDGGGPIYIKTADRTSKPFIRRVSIPLGSTGKHSVTISASQAPVYFAGLTAFDGNRFSGVHVYDSGFGGATVLTFLQDQDNFKRSLAATKPQLVTIELGVNDYEKQTAPAVFKSQMQQLVDLVDSVPGNPSVMIIIPYQIKEKAGERYGYQTYVQVLQALAAADPGNIALLDLSMNMPAADTSGASYYTTDGIHPNGFGEQVIANLVYDSITR